MSKIKIRKNDKRISAFVKEVTSTLLDGKRYQATGLGTFSTCTRKAIKDKAACKMAMFRASAELRDYALGGSFPTVAGPHSEIVQLIIEAMQCEEGIDVPFLGRLAVVPVTGKNPKLIFHGSEELNSALDATQ